MKSIFVPTDFSACAGYATEAAILLAKKSGAAVTLYTCLDLPYDWHSRSEEAKNDDAESMQKIANAQVLMDNIKKDYPGVPIKTVISGGVLLENIDHYVKNYGVDMVVMGSHGASGKNEYLIGSHTQKVVRLVHCPVLVVKNKLSKLDFKKVVFASSFNTNERASFLKFKSFIKHFLPEIHLVAIQTSAFFDPPYVVQQAAMNDFKELAKPLVCQTHILRDYSIDSGVRYFADEIGADMIAISNHNRHPIKRIFAGSNVEALVNHSDVPVLTIDFQTEE